MNGNRHTQAAQKEHTHTEVKHLYEALKHSIPTKYLYMVWPNNIYI